MQDTLTTRNRTERHAQSPPTLRASGKHFHAPSDAIVAEAEAATAAAAVTGLTPEYPAAAADVG